MFILSRAILAFILFQPNDDPQQLYGALEEKIAKAETLLISVTGKVEGDDKASTFKGKLLVAPRDKLYFDFKHELPGKPYRRTVLSDGVTLTVTHDGKGIPAKKTPKFLRSVPTVLLARTGFYVIFDNGSAPFNGDDPLKVLLVSDFKKHPGEKVDGRDALVISYKVTFEKTEIFTTAKVWLDAKSQVPLKRVLAGSKLTDFHTITEVYSTFQINLKIEGNPFASP